MRTLAKLVELALAFGCIGAFWALAVHSIGLLQAARCPAGAFACGSPRVASIFVMVTPFFAAIGPGFIAANAMTGAFPGSRRFFDGNASSRKSAALQAGEVLLLRWTLVFAFAGILLSFFASYAQFCLTPDAIFTRSSPWEPMQSHPWSAVRSVTSTCSQSSKGSWSSGYELGLSDGRTLDIVSGSGNAWKAQEQMFKALHPIAFRFDASRVEAGCGVVYADMLARRP